MVPWQSGGRRWKLRYREAIIRSVYCTIVVLARSKPAMVRHGILCHFPQVFTTEQEQCDDGRFLASLS